MNELIKWIINSGKFTDWLMVILTIILSVPIIISLNDRYNWLSKIKVVIKYFLNILLLVRIRKNIYLLLKINKINRYFNNIDIQNEIKRGNFNIRYNDSNSLGKIIRKIQKINLFDGNNTIEISIKDIDNLSRFKLDKFKKSAPSEFITKLIEISLRFDKLNINNYNIDRISSYLDYKYFSKYDLYKNDINGNFIKQQINIY